MRFRPWAPLVAVLLVGAACSQETGRLSHEQEERFAAEGVLRRADNLRFRWTAGAGRRGGTWEDRLASIVVTRQSVLIHKNEKVGIEITAGQGRQYEVHREGDRIRISGGKGRSAETWSFLPPANAEGWAQDIRAVIRGGSPGAVGKP